MPAVRHLINRGFGFSQGTVKYIPTLGLSPGVVSGANIKMFAQSLLPTLGIANLLPSMFAESVTDTVEAGTMKPTMFAESILPTLGGEGIRE